MQVIEYYSGDCQAYWLEEIKKSDWDAGQYLYWLLQKNELRTLCGETTKVLLLVEGDRLLSFCTYAEQDEVRDPSLTPWIGFVYTFPEYRGRRRMGKLLEYAYALSKRNGYAHSYISTGEVGLYEKYGYLFWKTGKDINGKESRIYRNDIVTRDYRHVIGRAVRGTIDRPLGTVHPRHPDIVYPINYGYVDGMMGGDGGEQDAYVFGADGPITTFSGRVVAVVHRLNDCEDKWIVSVNRSKPSKEDILRGIEFQEQYFMGELYL